MDELLMESRKRNGFTLVELLVVIAIIGVLMALLMPAIQAAREAARRATCQNNLKQIGLGLHNYADAKKRLPVGARAHANGMGFSWWVSILPYLEETAVYENFDFRHGAQEEVNHIVVDKVELSFMKCPTSTVPSQRQIKLMMPPPSFKTIEATSALPAYVGIAGSANSHDFIEQRISKCCSGSPPNLGQASGGGMLIPNSAISLNISDGTSKTLIVAETSDFAFDAAGNPKNIGGGNPNGWHSGTIAVGTPPDYKHRTPGLAPPQYFNIVTINYPINTRTIPLVGISESHGPNNPLTSPHSGGVYGVMVDGSVRFLEDSMDLVVLRRLATRDDHSFVE
jgi:prepilin-type N-terminal cleavage/methylation domain-containing protein